MVFVVGSFKSEKIKLLSSSKTLIWIVASCAFIKFPDVDALTEIVIVSAVLSPIMESSIALMVTYWVVFQFAEVNVKLFWTISNSVDDVTISKVTSDVGASESIIPIWVVFEYSPFEVSLIVYVKDSFAITLIVSTSSVLNWIEVSREANLAFGYW